MKTILHIKHLYLPISETFVYEYIRGIKNYHCIVASVLTKNLKLFPYNELFSADSEPLYKQYWNYIIQKATRVFRTQYRITPFYDKIVRNYKPDLLHAHFGMEGVQSLFLKHRYGIPLLTIFYGVDFSVKSKETYWKKAFKKLFNEGDLFIVLSEDMKNDLTNIGCPSAKIKVHRLGIDINKFKFTVRKPQKSGEPIIIYSCARFTEKKGLEYLIKAFAKVRNKHKDTVLKIVGDGPLRKKLHKLTDELNLKDCVYFLGYLPYQELPRMLYNSHIFVLPSVTASNGDKDEISMVIVEALATGLPVVTSYHAGINEVIKDGVHGFLAHERNVDEIAEKLNILIENQSLWKDIGLAGRTLVENEFDIEKQIPKLEYIYSQLIKQRVSQ